MASPDIHRLSLIDDVLRHPSSIRIPNNKFRLGTLSTRPSLVAMVTGTATMTCSTQTAIKAVRGMLVATHSTGRTIWATLNTCARPVA